MQFYAERVQYSALLTKNKIINQEKRVFRTCTKLSFLLIDNIAIELFFINTGALYQTKENPSNRDPDSVVEDRQRRVQYNGQQAVHDNGHGPTRYG
jgi:hypothetical protein